MKYLISCPSVPSYLPWKRGMSGQRKVCRQSAKTSAKERASAKAVVGRHAVASKKRVRGPLLLKNIRQLDAYRATSASESS